MEPMAIGAEVVFGMSEDGEDEVPCDGCFQSGRILVLARHAHRCRVPGMTDPGAALVERSQALPRSAPATRIMVTQIDRPLPDCRLQIKRG